MQTTYTRETAARLKADLQAVTADQAKKFLYKHGYTSTSSILPEYYRPGGFKKMTSLDALNWSAKNPKNIGLRTTKTLELVTPKGRLSWRNFSFAHPYIFWHKVEEITNPKSWTEIKNILCRPTLVCSYSVPVFKKMKKKKHNAHSIINWLQMAEKDLIKDAGAFHFLTNTDIENFYPSIYTHSIVWATNTKSIGKQRRTDKTLLGNRLDKLFQNTRDQQTNGIPIGSLISDLIAELILSDVDVKLSNFISTEKLTSRVLVARFRDDYRILSRSAEDGSRVLKALGDILRSEYDLRLNEKKTKQYSDIIEGSYRAWMLDVKSCPLLRKIYYRDFSDCCKGKTFRDCLLETYRLQIKHSDSRLSVVILSKLADAFYKKPNLLSMRQEEVPELISILRKITLLREEATPYTYVLFDILLSQVQDKQDKTKLLRTISFMMTGNRDDTYQLIWFYRLCLSHNFRLCKGILSKQNAPLLLSMDEKRYLYDYECFENCGLSLTDEISMQAFHLINRKKLKECRDKRINPSSLNPFGSKY